MTPHNFFLGYLDINNCMKKLSSISISIIFESFLNEDSRSDFLLKTYDKKLTDKWEAEKDSEPTFVVDSVEGMKTGSVAGDLIAYIMSNDPTPKKAFSQWMTVKYIQGGYKLEDIERLSQYLDVFEKAKSRIEKKDINQYKNITELFSVIDVFLKKEVAVSAKDEKNQEYILMNSPENSTIIYDDANLKIVIPLTQAAAIYFGKNTEWCTSATTSRNYFDSYNSRGPLYIVLDKKNNRRWQFHITKGYNNHDITLMDEKDRSYPIATLAKEFPLIIPKVGEEKFLPFMKDIGFAPFSKAAIESIKYDDLVKLTLAEPRGYRSEDKEKIPLIKQKLSELPPDIRNDPVFIRALIVADPLAAKCFNLKEYKAMIPEIMEENSDLAKYLPDSLKTPEMMHKALEDSPENIRYVPKSMMSQELVDTAVGRIAEGGSTLFFFIKNNIPEMYWTDDIKKKYYESMSTNEYHAKQLSDIPREYLTPNIIMRIVYRNNKEIKKHPDLVTEPILLNLVSNSNNISNFISITLPEIPEDKLTKNLCKAIMDKVSRQTGSREYEKYYNMSLFKVENMTPELIEKIVTTSDYGVAKIPFSVMPDTVKNNPDILYKWVESKKGNIKQIPAEYLTPQFCSKFMDGYYYGAEEKQNFNYLWKLGAINEEMMLNKLNKDKNFDASHLYDIMKNFKISKALTLAFANRGCADLSVIPVEDMTDDMIINIAGKNRYGDDNTENLKKIPAGRWTVELVEKLIKINKDDVLEFVPRELLTESVLYTYITEHQHGYGKSSKDNLLKLFSESTWSKRCIIRAVKDAMIKPSDVPERFLTSQAVVAVMFARDDELIKDKKFASFMTEPVLMAAVATNFHLVFELDEKYLNEPVLYAAIKGNCGSNYLNKDFAKLPRENFSQRIYDEAVGYFISLKEVPVKFRKAETVKLAITRDAENIRFLKDPATYMNKLGLTPKEVKIPEDHGVFWVKKANKFENAIAVPELKEFANGYASKVMVGTKNFQVFVYDKSKRMIVRLFTDKGFVKYTDASWDDRKTQQALLKKHLPLLVEVAKEYFEHDDLAELNGLGIYKERGTIGLEKEIPREDIGGGMSWSKPSHGKGGNMYTGWFGDKPIIRILESASGGGWGNNKSVKIHNVELIDLAKCIKHTDLIMRAIKKYRLTGWSHTLESIGIKSMKDGSFKNLSEVKLLNTDGYAITCDKEKSVVSVFSNKTGLVASSRISTLGKVLSFDDKSRHNDENDKVLPEEKIKAMIDLGVKAIQHVDPKKKK
jgi:hypothetical protein